MNIFLTGAAGYIGGSLAAGLLAAGHRVRGLVRGPAQADTVRTCGITPVLGTLDDTASLAEEARAADAVINAANADHEAAARALTDALAGTGRAYIHISGSSVVGTQAGGRLEEAVYQEGTPFTPSPGRAARAALNAAILAGRDRGFRPIIICPSLIYGAGRGVKRDSMQIPWLIATTRKHGIPCHAGPGENRWSNVHIDDLVRLALLALERAPAGGFYFAENGENSMRELCQAIGRMLGLGPATRALNPAEAAAEWGENAALNTMGSNSRVRAVAARATLGWAPRAGSAIEEIERGCYALTR